MLVAGDLIKKCSITLKDPEFVRWTEDELLAYLDEAHREIARVAPGSYVKTVVQDLVKGSKQALPADAFLLVSVVRNMTELDEPCEPVRITTRALLDSFEPHWHMCPQRRLAENYVYDDRTPKVYYVYPPNDGSGHVEVMYNAIPEKLTAISDVLVLRDEFETPLMMYVLYRAYNKDSDYSPGLQIASSYYQSYMTSVQQAMQAAGMKTPNTNLIKGAVKPNGGTE